MQGWTMPDELKVMALPRAARPTDTSLWKARARDLATAYYKRDRVKKLNPSKDDLGVEIAKTLDKEGLRGPRGAISGPTIVRHALNDWQKPK
jgi:hypothetical protein